MSIIGSIFVRLGLKSDEFSKGIKQSEGQLSSFKGVVGKIGGAIAGAFTVDKIVQFTKEAYKLAGQAQGVYNAFSRLNRPGLLNDLKEATRGTTDELQLMQTAVRASNFKIPLDQLATYLKFATNRAIETGESVDYLVNSLVLGIGRKSPLILDNLSISTVRLREELAKTGDMAKAVGNIIEEEMKKDGDAIETSAVKVQRLSAAWKDLKTAYGNSAWVKNIADSIVDNLTVAINSISSIFKSNAQIWYETDIKMGANLGKRWLQIYEKYKKATGSLKDDYSEYLDLLKKGFSSSPQTNTDSIRQLNSDTINGIKAQIAALEELRAEEANPEKRAAYTSEIESLKKRLELMTSTNTVVKGSIDYINQQIEAQEKLYNSTNIQSVRDMAAAKKEELEAAKALLEITEKDKQKRDEALKGNIASGYSTQGMGGSFWLKRVEEKNKLEKNLASYSYDPTLYKNAKNQATQFNEIAEEVKQAANSIHQTITTAMSDALISLAEGIGSMGGIDMSPLADVIIQVGKMAIKTGVAILGIKKALESLNPFVAIAAGTALVALGTAVKKSLSNIGSEIGGGYSPNTSFSGGGSYSGASSQYGYASYRAQSVDVNVTGRISGQDIVLASDKYLKNKSR